MEYILWPAIKLNFVWNNILNLSILRFIQYDHGHRGPWLLHPVCSLTVRELYEFFQQIIWCRTCWKDTVLFSRTYKVSLFIFNKSQLFYSIFFSLCIGGVQSSSHFYKYSCAASAHDAPHDIFDKIVFLPHFSADFTCSVSKSDCAFVPVTRLAVGSSMITSSGCRGTRIWCRRRSEKAGGLAHCVYCGFYFVVRIRTRVETIAVLFLYRFCSQRL